MVQTLQMKSPMGLRAWLIYQVRAAGELGPVLVLMGLEPGYRSMSPVAHIALGGVWLLHPADWCLSFAITGLEDGGVKASPAPSDPEKPGTPGEGVLSSDLDRIPTEGEACTGLLRPPRGRKVLSVGLLCTALAGEPWPPSVAVTTCGSVVPLGPLSSVLCHPPQNCPRWSPRTCSSFLRMCWAQSESSLWVVELLASKAAGHHCRGPFSKVFMAGAASKPATANLVP